MKRLLLASTLTAISMGVMSATLPADLEWQSNWDAPLFASEQAQFGGTYRTYLSSFPQTLRSVGPDSNSGLRSWFADDVPNLVSMHPNTLEWIPDLANEWAFGDDNKTVYFKLNPQAKWSDGKPVTADDFVFMLKFYRSKDIVAPWYNEYYSKQVADVIKFDQHTLAFVAGSEKNKDDLLYSLGGLTPRPAHFYANPSKDENGDGIDDNFVRKYNFKSEPTTFAYYLDDVKKGKSVTFKHVGEDWWGYSNRYYQHRYNVEKVRMTVIRDHDIAMKHFEKGKLDSFALVMPSLWHDKSNSEPYQKGYIAKFWGYNQYPQGAGGLWLNTANPLLSDLNVRKGVALATDFDGMIEKITRGDYVRQPNALGVGHGEYDLSDAVPPKFDPGQAAEYFAKAGFDKLDAEGIRVNDQGQRLSFAITYSFAVHTPRMSFLKEQAKLAGLEFTLNLVDGSSAFKYMLEKKHEVAFLTMGTFEVPQYWGYFHSVNANKPQTNNFTNYSTPELDKLIMAFKHEFDLDKKRAISRQIQTIVNQAAVIVPGYMVPYTREGHWRWLKYPKQAMTKRSAALFSSVAPGLGLYWIDPDVKKETLKAMKSGKTFEPVVVIDDTYKL
ncbi:extracellular solute-binding protein [Vibrio sp. CAU 1672]|uniref:extracellular solute-binding protein n=1 Tax=Vibrio sp. CAU 1672 TaxID=3032594 RepID=UPI0023DA42DB|nr:extracellular solute-binding protein [Vibrio sp. CAU 1672]MDF2153959.1 extracellular solute-binding protein [Vibrio sp. CAU 1672]